jgi:hypothetical protein
MITEEVVAASAVVVRAAVSVWPQAATAHSAASQTPTRRLGKLDGFELFVIGTSYIAFPPSEEQA